MLSLEQFNNTFIMIGLHETFIKSWGVIETLDNKKQIEEGREVEYGGDEEREN